MEIDQLSEWLRPHAKVAVQWALRGGRRAIFANFGLHKTSMQLEMMRQIKRRTSAPTLITLPLGVRQEFRRDADAMGVSLKFIRSAAEIGADIDVHLTNYETVREGKLDPAMFAGASLDEAAVLRSYGSKTYQEFLPLFDKVPYRFVATATPSPNRYKELIHYAGFLGVMDTGQALTRFFQRDSEKANNLTLYPHKEDEFWMWVHSWALFIQKPSDLGFSDEGYEQPPLEVRYHAVPSDHSTAGMETNGQGILLRDAAVGLMEAAREKRDSMPARIACMADLIAQDPDEHCILWHDLEAERHAIEAAVSGAKSVYGSLDLETREQRIIDFSDGKAKYLPTKPELSGSGCNFQRHCHWSIFTGIGFKFHDFIQAVHRIRRFGQPLPCRIDIIYSEAEQKVLDDLLEKWRAHDAMMDKMADIIRRYGLSHRPMREELTRSIGHKRIEARGANYVVANNDCVEEARLHPSSSVGLIVTSIPFSNHYEYTPSYNDFGHTDNNAHFWAQMDFLTPELLRILEPGRLACIHVKDRILFGNVTGAGAPTVSPLHAEAIMHFLRHRFDYMGMIHINTDVVRENNQTYRLGYTEMCKDGTKMGVGSPEYVLLMRKPQSDRSRGYADVPVTKDKSEYSLARWQVDAHAFWRSSGNRLLTPEEMAALKPNLLLRTFTEQSLRAVYDYQAHVATGERIEAQREGALPRTFMALAPGAHDPNTWHDVNRMRTLNGNQVQRNVEKHVCPLQFDIVDRLIDRYSNRGDLVYDPFGGLMTVPYRAILRGRRGQASELSADYFRDGVHYLEAAERELSIPSLFDAVDCEAAA
ncbi:MAG TPA: DNA methyltransferase [Rhizomicrobium sp.]|nr:DNA methyltransferase [Rhizomicrobium sp.]